MHSLSSLSFVCSWAMYIFMLHVFVRVLGVKACVHCAFDCADAVMRIGVETVSWFWLQRVSSLTEKYRDFFCRKKRLRIAMTLAVSLNNCSKTQQWRMQQWRMSCNRSSYRPLSLCSKCLVPFYICIVLFTIVEVFLLEKNSLSAP